MPGALHYWAFIPARVFLAPGVAATAVARSLSFGAATAALAQVACAFLLAANIREHNVKSVRDDCESIVPGQYVITRMVEIEGRMRSRKIERADFAARTNWKNGRAACG